MQVYAQTVCLGQQAQASEIVFVIAVNTFQTGFVPLKHLKQQLYFLILLLRFGSPQCCSVWQDSASWFQCSAAQLMCAILSSLLQSDELCIYAECHSSKHHFANPLYAVLSTLLTLMSSGCARTRAGTQP